ncbi:MAG: hypothetical protein F6K63_03700 [Moorea sp. SIO1G6]|uniref:hypothetical protein n=1 Tax=Moorena sp. SIO1G6 TaxID=2607840 RepID=UPI0013C11368|nr:hypothetical protein [Moorena sp. SIO1G6]NET63551.1 hypothetical protein [Moorena sp. SIO1G6]
MRYTLFFTYCLLPIAYCLLPIAYCLLPIAYCLPLLGGVRGGFLLPIAYCLLPITCSLLPKTQRFVPDEYDSCYIQVPSIKARAVNQIFKIRFGDFGTR